MRDTYPAPEHGWTCFHCGECFTTRNEARDHFGMDGDIDATPACRIPAEHVRAELRRYRVVESELRGIADELLDIRSCGDGAPFLERDHDRFYDLCTKAIDALLGRSAEEPT